MKKITRGAFALLFCLCSFGAFGQSTATVASLKMQLRTQLLKVGCDGDSLSSQLIGSQFPASDSGVGTKATTMPFDGGNLFCIGCRLAGVEFERSAGVGGQPSGTIAGRTASDVIASSGGGRNVYLPAPNVCTVLMGTDDDITVSNAVLVAYNNITSVWTQLIGAGILPIACTIPPRSDNGQGGFPAYSSAGTYANRLIFNSQLNAKIRAGANLYGIPLLDIDALFNDGTGAHAGGYGKWSTDGIHFTTAAQFAGGQADAAILKSISSVTIPLSSNNADPLIVPGQTIVTQLKGSALVTAVTAGQPDGYGTSNTGNASLWNATFSTEPSDGLYQRGNWAKMAYSGAYPAVTSTSDYLSFCENTYNSNSWAPTPGHLMRFSVCMTTNGTVAGNSNWSVYLICNQSFNGRSIGSYTVGLANQCVYDTPVDQYPQGQILSRRFIVPPNTTSMQLSVRVQANATGQPISGNLRICQPTLIDMDAMGLSLDYRDELAQILGRAA